LFFALLAPDSLGAKTVGLTVVELYPGTDGTSYAQIADFVLNGKNEVSLCPGTPSIDKSTYHKLPRITLTAGMTLERNADGILMLTQTTNARTCAIPANVKFDKGDSLSLSDLADRAEIEGRVLPESDPASGQPVPIKPGVKLVFLSAPDQEMAAFLRAQRSANIQGWQAYLKKYPSAAHSSAAKESLAALFLAAGKSDSDAYLLSKNTDSIAYEKLKAAREMTLQAQALASTNDEITVQAKKIQAEVQSISTAAATNLEQYLLALNKQTPGYSHLVTAEKLADASYEVDPTAPETIDAQKQTKEARAAFDRALRECDSQIAAQHPDEALKRLGPIRSFAEENPKVSADLRAIAALYVARAKKLEEADVPDWPGAVQALESAQAVAASPDTLALLNDAKQKHQVASTRAAADAALLRSNQFEESKDIRSAYEVLDDLPADQRALVTDRLDALKDQYVTEAEKAARGLQKAHEPINALSDEIGIQRAYDYLQRCYRLTSDPDLQTRLSILAGDLSTYYLRQGKKYAEKPDGSGVNIGWTYLSEALQYKSPITLGDVNDEKARVGAAHALKSRLSIRVEFRDQTSRREAVDFASQLTDAMATGLESAGLNVKAVRPQESTIVQPHFQMVGEVIRNDKSTSQDTVAKDSTYRFGQQQVPNAEWVKADQDYEKANMELQSARSALVGAQARGKKKDIDQAQSVVQADEAKVNDLLSKRNALPQNIFHDEERPYTYTQTNYHLKVVVEIDFRILDGSGDEVVRRVAVSRDKSTDYAVLEDVKPEDTKGVRKGGAIPNDNDVLEQAETEARDELIKTARTKVVELPGIVLAEADRRAKEDDNDGAAELYILYLNSTPVADTPERKKARDFLIQQFNFRDIAKASYSE
jgi:hypothetical protein